MIERKDCSKNLADAVMRGSLQTTNAKSRGVKTGNFCVIRDTLVPSILVEGGFLTNERELAKIRQDAYLRSLAQGIVDGIESYFEKK
jgi:N-acetylmuramoyl-L-alanine amidase